MIFDLAEIAQTDESLPAFIFHFHADWTDVLGKYRMEMINEVLEGSMILQLQASLMVAETGSLRNFVNMRPEVLIDATGRLI